jgi:hypothetical protein
VNLHALNPDTLCPSCGQASLVYVHTRKGGDIYRCAVEGGGCERTIKHRKMMGSDACGIGTVFQGAQTGPWLPCPALAAKGERRAMDPEDEAMLAELAIAEMVPRSDEQRERLSRLTDAGYAALADRKRRYANILRVPGLSAHRAGSGVD